MNFSFHHPPRQLIYSTSSGTDIKTEATTVTNITCTKIDVNRNNINRHEWKKEKEEKERRAKKY